jgi:molybdopterin-biosynthesis enzyme MoeA-like protein
MIGKALENLGVWDYVLLGDPKNEQEFNSMFRKVVGEDENQSSILSDDVSTFGITWNQVSTELNRITQEYNNTEYQRLRKTEYPPIGDQLDNLFHAGAFSPEMSAQIQAVKDKYPKGS